MDKLYKVMTTMSWTREKGLFRGEKNLIAFFLKKYLNYLLCAINEYNSNFFNRSKMNNLFFSFIYTKVNEL